jgi:hypothetical protein
MSTFEWLVLVGSWVPLLAVVVARSLSSRRRRRRYEAAEAAAANQRHLSRRIDRLHATIQLARRPVRPPEKPS